MIKYTPLKSKVIRYSGRSSDFIFPSISQGCFGGENIRYDIKLKNYLIKEFRELLYSYLPYCKIKYIF